MTYYYSPSVNAFYSDELKQDYISAGTFPDDAITVSTSIWMKYAGEGPPLGMIRVSGEDGMPKWSPKPEDSQEDKVKKVEDKKSEILSEIINVTHIWQTQLSLKIINDSDKSKLKEWMLYAQKIQSIDASKAPDIVWPEPPKK